MKTTIFFFSVFTLLLLATFCSYAQVSGSAKGSFQGIPVELKDFFTSFDKSLSAGVGFQSSI